MITAPGESVDFHSSPRPLAQELYSCRACLGVRTEAKASVWFGTKKGQGWISGGARHFPGRSHLFLIRWRGGVESIFLNCLVQLLWVRRGAEGGVAAPPQPGLDFENGLAFLLCLPRLGEKHFRVACSHLLHNWMRVCVCVCVCVCVWRDSVCAGELLLGKVSR